MQRTFVTMIFFIALYGAIIVPFTEYLHRKPIAEKIGYVPSVTALRSIAADHKELVAASLILKVVMYFGGMIEKARNELEIAPDYVSMSRLLHGAVKLDPYNMDAYYFAQGFLPWDVKQFKIANDLLDYGMKYRTWDWQLPFFAGFNSAFFLKDYKAAARYYQRVSELSGPDISPLLAGRYMQESGQTELAIIYLSTLVKKENNPALKKNILIRLEAFKATRRIEIARDRFHDATGTLPTTVDQLIQAGYLSAIPVDPYGGRFYLEPGGKVVTTSKFAFAGATKEKKLKESK